MGFSLFFFAGIFEFSVTHESSLRANGSRERAPDDRLCEAIQKMNDASGLLRRFCSSQ
jgi:hypothetical protein